MRIALQPSSSKESLIHYENTVNNLVPIGSIAQFAPPEVAEKLSQLFPEGSAAVWGVTPGKTGGNVTKWDQLSIGDLVIFAKNKSLFAKGTVVAKFRSIQLARRLWGEDANGMTWEYVYLLTDVSLINISQAEMNIALGYKENNVVQGFQVLTIDQSRLLDEALELAGEVLLPEVSQEDFQEAVAPFDPSTALDKDVRSKYRKEQAFLRKSLFEHRRKGVCAICNKEYGVEFLRTAHLKARSQCTQEERLDVKNIVLPMCAFGCDELYERGHIGVEQGKIVCVKPLATDDAARTYLAGIVGLDCRMWTKEREPYFKWHRLRNGQS
jgi:hypothetical protein